jgi:sigma-B regulation protein RsbU (phosphoserine phosphatase)
MKLFYFLSRNISYTFAVAFLTNILGWFTVGFSYFLASSFVLTSYDKVTGLFFQWLPIVFLSVSFLYFVSFGFFTPVKIPAFFKRHRRINSLFSRNMKADESDLKNYYGDFSDLVMNNTGSSVIIVVITGAAMMITAFTSYYIYGDFTFIEFRSAVKMIILASVIAVLLIGMATHLMTENLTNNERAGLYNDMLRRGNKIKPHSLIGVNVNFYFFVIIMFIILFSIIALLERLRVYEPGNIITLGIYLAGSIIIGLALARVNANAILKILNDMSRVTREIASGKRAGFNILSLGKEFSSIEFALMEMAWEIEEHRRNLELKVQERTDELERAMTSLRIRDDQIQKQLDMASVIQRSMLPDRLDDWNEIKFSVRYNAMEKIGGDFYDIFQLKDNKIGVIIADVSGHGIPAALVTAMAKISFGNAGILFDSPRRIYQEVNKNIIEHMKTQDYLTCFMIAVDDDYNVTYSNASHQKAVLLRENGEIEYLDTGGLFIGALEEARDTYEEKQTSISYGDRIILYTDGIPEAQNSEKKEYSNEGFERSILSHKDKDLEDFTEAIIGDVRDYMGDVGSLDDITLLIIELAWDEAVDIVKNSRKMVAAHKYLEAIEMLENGLARLPGNQKILYNLAKNYFRVNNYSKAVHTIEKYLEKDKKNKFAYYINGASHYQMMDYKSAVEQFNLAVSIDQNMVNALFALAMSYKNLGDYDSAVQIFERVINIDSDNKMALFEIRQIEKMKSGN